MRIVATFLLSLFMLQSSGAAALAGQRHSLGLPPLQAQIAAMVQPIIAAVQWSPTIAMMIGQPARAEQLQALQQRARQPRPHANPDLHQPHTLPILRYGVRINPSTQQSGSILPKPPRPRNGGVVRHAALVTASSPASTTGTTSWWTYASGGIPGVGKWNVNVASGNLLVHSGDVNIPERGINLDFERTYNSQSTHDYANTDGSTPAIYGNGWTSNLDVHVAYNSGLNAACPTTQGVSVYDGDGTRYDYKPDCSGGYIAPVGMAGTVVAYANGNSCRYTWTLKSGVMYDFWIPDVSKCFAGGINGAYGGRLYRMYGRNRNNYVELDYSWANGDATSIANLTSITAKHSDGQQMVLTFGAVSGYQELVSLQRPDGTLISYKYDNSGRLTEVDHPGNGSNNGAALVENYGYWSGQPYRLNWVGSPNWNASAGAAGSYTWFDYNSTGNTISGVQLFGWGNLTPNDGTNTPLQPSLPQQYQTLVYDTFTYYSWGTNLTDTDGHSTNWWTDSLGRVTQLAWKTGDPSGAPAAFYSWATWDSSNNLIETVDARSNATDYAYDNYGNVVAMALPAVTTSAGTFRPTSLYSYASGAPSDLVQYCDPVFTHSIGKDWTTNPGNSDQLCPSQLGATRYGWVIGNSSEPYGYVTDIISPTGYHQSISYDQTIQGGDFGLPTRVQGDSFSQADGTTRTPAIQLTYNATGTLATYSNNIGTWNLAYDNMNRLTTSTDPDNVTSRSCYNADSTVSATQTAYQYALDGNIGCGSHSEVYTYDADGNEVTETHHFGQTATNGVTNGVTQKWYDGADRLVEVSLPVDNTINPTTSGGQPDPTRYIYDLTQGGSTGTTQVNGTTVVAHGGMFKTQMCIEANSAPPCAWYDTRGAAYDALDRATQKYSFVPKQNDLTSPTMETTTFTYDANGYTGLLTQKADPIGVTSTLAYDQLDEITSVAFSDGSTPNRAYAYDPDGQVTSITSARFGTESYTYNRDGNLTQKQEANGNGVTGAGLITYDYYPDGTRQDLQIKTGPAQLAGRTLFQYAYRNDGLPSWLKFDAASQPFTWGYTNAGRQQTQGDPASGTSAPNGPLTSRWQYYDGYGQLSKLILPSGNQYTNIAHDAEGLITSYVAQTTGSTPTIVTYSQGYDVRGEAVAQGYNPGTTAVPSYNEGGSYSYYGSLTKNPYPSYVDPRMGALVSSPAPNACTSTTGSTTAGSVSPNYDPDGRISGTGVTCGTTVSQLESFAYDAENHTIADSCTGVNSACSASNNTYAWGPGGNPISVTQGIPGPYIGKQYSLHWDGNQLLYVTDTSGSLVQLNLGQLATWTGATGVLTVSDRDFGPGQVSQHQNGATDQWIAGGSRYGTFAGEGPFTGAADQGSRFLVNGQILGSNRVDGYDDVNLSLQGVRAYARGLGQWTTPDGYAGDMDNPMTQRSYLWNGNNPLENVDPTGLEYQGCGQGSVTISGPGQPVYGDVDSACPNPSGSADDGFDIAVDIGGGVDIVGGRGGGKPPCDTEVGAGMLPPSLSWSKIYADGAAHPGDITHYYDVLHNGGIYDVQSVNPLYRASGNIAVGVYGQAARIPSAQMHAFINATLAWHQFIDPKHFDASAYRDDNKWADDGRNWAKAHCR